MDTPAGRFELAFEGDPQLDLQALSGIGPKTADRLAKRGYGNQGKLLLCLPRKYRTVHHHVSGQKLSREKSEYAEFLAPISWVDIPKKHSRAPIEVHVDVTGQTFKLLWFNMNKRSFTRSLKVGTWLRLAGEIDWDRGLPTMIHPTFEFLGKNKPNIPPPRISIEPVYPSFENIPDYRLETAIDQAADNLLASAKDILPTRIREQRNLLSVREAFEILHVRKEYTDYDEFEKLVDEAKRRLKYEEFFTLQLKLAEDYAESRRAADAPICDDRSLGRDFVRTLPFKLTGDQGSAIARIANDLGGQMPMRRLLQGDVGSGKTIVAFMAVAICVGNDKQAAMMAPTDILATQHHRRATELFADFPVDVELLTSSQSAEHRKNTLERLATGDLDFVIGTHAIFQDDVSFRDLGFAIIDEQHKFGVEQRQQLLEKGNSPHLLAMTATPIPRSLAHTAFGDLDLTLIREKPPGRKEIKTFFRREDRGPKVYDYIRKRVLESDQQAYFVYPMIEPSPKMPNRKSVLESARKLANGPFSELRVGVLHGQMPGEAKTETMQAFADGDIDVLCATTVVEVGMDVERATMMVIESPEAFGLSQLHQLRGRVGRGFSESMCVLIAGHHLSDTARDRLESFVETTDGFELAERDLQLRGPGEFLGDEQTGLPEFRFGDLIEDAELLETAREDARRHMLGDAAVD